MGPDPSPLVDAVGTWLRETGRAITTSYTVGDREQIDFRLGGLIQWLREEHAVHVPESELHAAELFIEAAFVNWEDSFAMPSSRKGGFAFLVPLRMSRLNPEYAGECPIVMPLMRHVPWELRASLLVGMPPFVIDTYGAGPGCLRGFLVWTPIFLDQALDQPDTVLTDSRVAIDMAVGFAARRFGVDVVGLGAVLPAITRFGATLRDHGVVTTTGHAGTAALVLDIVHRSIAGEHPVIGVLGLGSIGSSLAVLLHQEFPDASIQLHDKRVKQEEILLTKHPQLRDGRTSWSASVEQMLAQCNIVIAAVTSKVDLTGLVSVDLTGKTIIDDSQPAAFDPAQVEALGGRVEWVIGRAPTLLARTYFDYGHMVDAQLDVFGCEAEAGVIAQSACEMRAEGRSEEGISRWLRSVALSEAVTPAKAKSMHALFSRHGIKPAPPQAFGRYLENADHQTRTLWSSADAHEPASDQRV